MASPYIAADVKWLKCPTSKRAISFEHGSLKLSEYVTQILARSLRVDLQQAAFYLRAAHGDIRKAMQLHGRHLCISAANLLLADAVVMFDGPVAVMKMLLCCRT